MLFKKIVILAEKIFFEFFGKRSLENYLKSIEFFSGKGGRVLDVGCGYGWYSELFSENYTGIDIDAEKVKDAKRRYPLGNFQEMSATKLRFPDKSFDLVFSIAVLHHLSDEELTRAVGEILRVVKDGGRIFIIDMVLPKKRSWLGSLFFRIDKGSYKREFEQLTNIVVKTGLKPRFQSLQSFLGIGVAVLEVIPLS